MADDDNKKPGHYGMNVSGMRRSATGNGISDPPKKYLVMRAVSLLSAEAV